MSKTKSTTQQAKISLTKSPFVRLQAKFSKQSVAACAARLRRSVTKAIPSSQTMRRVGVIGLTVAIGVAAGHFGGRTLGSDLGQVVSSPLIPLSMHAMAVITGAGWGGLVGPSLATRKFDAAAPEIIRSKERRVPVKPAQMSKVA